MLASDSNLFDIPRDTLFARLSRMPYKPQFVHEMYLRDRLDDFKVGRLVSALQANTGTHTIGTPGLVMKEALYRSEANRADRMLAGAIFGHQWWLLIIPAGLVALFLSVFSTKRRAQRIGLLLYLTAGLVSLTAELTLFYLYQSLVGSLYSELATLIGVFMLGLALGTYWSLRRSPALVERGSLAALGLSLCGILGIPSIFSVLVAPVSFLIMLVAAAATGGLFVAATRRFYRPQVANTGIGYAAELAGSACGALLTTTVLLPTIGLNWLLTGCLILLSLCAVGVFVVSED